jgi:hypothetical protein
MELFIVNGWVTACEPGIDEGVAEAVETNVDSLVRF